MRERETREMKEERQRQRGWRDGSVVKSIGCSSRGPELVWLTANYNEIWCALLA